MTQAKSGLYKPTVGAALRKYQHMQVRELTPKDTDTTTSLSFHHNVICKLLNFRSTRGQNMRAPLHTVRLPCVPTLYCKYLLKYQ
jgi:hypothetical protein